MSMIGDRRGQSIALGALIIFSFLVLGFSFYQGQVVPNQNEAVEVNHQQRVSQDMAILQNAIVNTWADGLSRSATIEMGTTYPDRAIAINPPPPAGSLQNTTRGEITITVGGGPPPGPPGPPPHPGPSQQVDLEQLCEYPHQPTGQSLVYEPFYNEYGDAATIGYENTVKYRNFSGTFIIDSGQTLVRGTAVHVVPLAGDRSEVSRRSLTVQAIGGPTNSTTVNNSSLTMTFPSRIPAANWRSNETLFGDVDTVDSVSSPSPDTIEVSLVSDNYTITCRGIGLENPPPSGTG